MKRVLTIALMFSTLSLCAENVFTIFRISGEVKSSPISSNIWKDAIRRDTVKLSDRIIIPEGGEIRILSSETGIIYSCSQAGQTDVKHIIDKSNESINGIIGAVASELFDESVSKKDGKKISRVHGATSRGRNKNDYSQENALAKKIIKGDPRLELELVEVDDYYNFQVKSRKECNICIACFLPNSVALCLPASGVHVGKGINVLSFPELKPTPGASYRIFNVKDTFDESALCRILYQVRNQPVR